MSRERAKGTRGEREVVEALRRNGFQHAERRALHGSNDLGDVTGIPMVCIEVKNAARMELAAWVDEAEKERDNGRYDVGAVWHHRRGKGRAEDWFVTMTGQQFMALLILSGYGHLPVQRPS